MARTEQQPQEWREAEQKNDVDRQYVHVGGLEFEQHRLEQGLIWLAQEFEDVHFLGKEWVLKSARNIGDLGHENHEQKNVSHVELPDPLEDTRTCHDKAALAHRAAIDERGGIAGNEDEQLGCVAKPIIAKRERVDDIGRDMVEEDEPKREAAEKIEPHVTLRFDHGGHRE